MYGSGKPDAAPAPPVPQLCASNAVSLPSAETPARIFAYADGRLPVSRCSSLRSRNSFTGAFACCARRAHISASGPMFVLLPNPPPMYCVMQRMLACGIFRPSENCCREACTPCVVIHAVSLSPFHSQTQPWVSMQTCVMTCVEYDCSTMCAASLKPSSRLPFRSEPRRQLVAVPLADAAVGFHADVRDDVRRIRLLDDVCGQPEALFEVAVLFGVSATRVGAAREVDRKSV